MTTQRLSQGYRIPEYLNGLLWRKYGLPAWQGSLTYTILNYCKLVNAMDLSFPFEMACNTSTKICRFNFPQKVEPFPHSLKLDLPYKQP